MPHDEHDKAVALMGQYEFAESAALFDSIVSSHPDWIEARINHAIAVLNRQDDDDEHRALALLEETLRLQPDNLRAIYTSGIIHLYLGQIDQASRFLQQSAESDISDAYAAYFLGQTFFQAERYSDAVPWFEKSIELDSYLKSGYWALSQAYRRTGEVDKANRLLADFQRISVNPAATSAGFNYGEMGPLATAEVVPRQQVPAVEDPVSGPLFESPNVLFDGDVVDGLLTTVDLNGDAIQDLVLTLSTGTHVFFGSSSGFQEAEQHALTELSDSHATMWGDINGDGLVDGVVCAGDSISTWLQLAGGDWTRQVLSPDRTCTAGALFDADHDGDLDILTTDPGSIELWNNNGDDTFEAIGEEQGLSVGGGHQILVGDLDSDRDFDIAVFGSAGRNHIWRNDRTWRYVPYKALAKMETEPIDAASLADIDADGWNEIVAVSGEKLWVWSFDGAEWTSRVARSETITAVQAIDLKDMDGDGAADAVISFSTGIQVVSLDNAASLFRHDAPGVGSFSTVLGSPQAGPALIVATQEGLLEFAPGIGRHPFLSIVVTGQSEGETMRSNTSGIGTKISVRSAGRWSIGNTLDNHSGPGQSLQPFSTGLAGAKQADFVALDWSDGVTQSELDLETAQLHTIEEKQRQLGSCPIVFAWNGSEYRFVADILGGAALGYFRSRDSVSPVRPVEHLLISDDQLKSEAGRYRVKLGEPMEELAYLDAAKLVVHDIPEGWSMVLDERLATGDPPVTGKPVYFREEMKPAFASNSTGEDISELVAEADYVASPPGPTHTRFIGLLEENQSITLYFSKPLYEKDAVLVATGWVQYPYSQTVFAASQANLQYETSTIEVGTAGSEWRVVHANFGQPAGTPRTMSVPLGNLDPDTTQIRLTTNVEVYWDSFRVVRAEGKVAARTTELVPRVATVRDVGFPKRLTFAQNRPFFDYGDRYKPFDAKHQTGFYTAFGDARELVSTRDNALAIFGAGEEIHLEFDSVDPVPDSWRVYELIVYGWLKDMDLYTRDGELVSPVPIDMSLTSSNQERRELLHAKYNVRFESGL